MHFSIGNERFSNVTVLKEYAINSPVMAHRDNEIVFKVNIHFLKNSLHLQTLMLRAVVK